MFLGFFFSFSIFPFFLIILVNYISKLANNQDDASSSDKIKLLIKVYWVRETSCVSVKLEFDYFNQSSFLCSDVSNALLCHACTGMTSFQIPYWAELSGCARSRMVCYSHYLQWLHSAWRVQSASNKRFRVSSSPRCCQPLYKRPSHYWQ